MHIYLYTGLYELYNYFFSMQGVTLDYEMSYTINHTLCYDITYTMRDTLNYKLSNEHVGVDN